MGFPACSAIALLFVGASAFRVRPQKRSQSSARGQPAIGGIFAYAAPGSAQPGLKNPRSSKGCFPGIRTAAVQMQWFGQEADTATTITGVLGFRHPYMDFKLLDLKDPDNKNKLYTCDDEVPNQPRGASKIALHASEGYANATQDLDLGWGNLLYPLAKIGIPASYDYNRTSAAALGKQYGWPLIGSAVAEAGENGYVGRQVSHLFQKKRSKECILTFQGSSSMEDWKANLNIKKRPFCGFAPKDAYIAEDDDTSVLGDGQSLVHKGFIDALMLIVMDSDWQSDIRPKLSRCSQVYVTGHSLGGAQSELFGACVNMAPSKGQDGYEHYKYMSWTR